MAGIECRIDAAYRRVAAAAANWVRGFYPGIEIEIEGDKVSLLAQDRDAGELRLIWTAALFNEAQLERQAAGRAAALAALVQ